MRSQEIPRLCNIEDSGDCVVRRLNERDAHLSRMAEDRLWKIVCERTTRQEVPRKRWRDSSE